jgi:hypothetical protein
MKAEFNERVFEFAYNAEFAATNRAVLLSMPWMPSQPEEKNRAYDVRFRLKRASGKGWSLMLQHKVVRRIDNKSPSNREWVKKCGVPYFAFGLDIEQYNRIVQLRGRGRAVYYCAPRFCERQALEDHYRTGAVCSSSIWLDPELAGQIADRRAHAIVFDLRGARAIRCSGLPREMKVIAPSDLAETRPSEPLRVESLREVYEELYSIAADRAGRRQGGAEEDRESSIRRDMPKRAEIDSLESAASAVGNLSADYFGLSWLFVLDETSDLA